MRNDLALTGIQTEAYFASLCHYLLNIRGDHTLRASQNEIVQITQRKVGAQRSNERMTPVLSSQGMKRLRCAVQFSGTMQSCYTTVW